MSLNLEDTSSYNFWSQQAASLHRYDTEKFYREKADEHVHLMRINDREVGAIDLGCGAGELLQHLMSKVYIKTALDYSESMLSRARSRLGNDAPELKNADVFDYLSDTEIPVWLTTGALNQYLSPAQITNLMKIFQANLNAQSFYLFDCVDPIRYDLLSFGISFNPEDMVTDKLPVYKRLSKYLRRVHLLFRMINKDSKDFSYLGSPSMGYGYLPKFWLKLGNDLGLSIQIASSRHYEYRYHVIFNKI